MIEEKNGLEIDLIESLADRKTYIKNLKCEKNKLHFTIYFIKQGLNINFTLDLLNCNESILKDKVNDINKKEIALFECVKQKSLKTLSNGVLITSIVGMLIGYMNPQYAVPIFLGSCLTGTVGSFIILLIPFTKQIELLKEDKYKIINLVIEENIKKELENKFDDLYYFILKESNILFVGETKIKRIKEITSESRAKLIEFKEKLQAIKLQNKNYNYKTNKNLIRSKSILSK